MKTIHKIQLRMADEQTHFLPSGSQLLTAQDQNGVLTVWYRCNPENVTHAVWFGIYGTGHSGEIPGQYLGTVQQGDFVWHIFYQL